MNYILASSTIWPIKAFLKKQPDLPGKWIIVTTPRDLGIIQAKPRYIFFPHWSWIVTEEITKKYECVGFHMGDLPGGSPLQHLIASGAPWTTITAFRMTKNLDAGPVYLKNAMALDGSAEDCYARASELSLGMIEWIVAREPTPSPQIPVGETEILKRRRPEESVLPGHAGYSLAQLYDFIRMLDANGYPRAFLYWGAYRLEFRDAKMSEGGLDAKVRISLRSTS